MPTALALLEFHSIAVGIEAGDAMAKRVALETLALGTAHPGKLLVAIGGDVASVEDAWRVGRDVGGRALSGEIYLPDVHPAVVAAFSGAERDLSRDALGILETTTVTATLHAADRALKGTAVSLAEFRLADGLGGKGYALFGGDVGEVEAAIELAGEAVRAEEVVARVVIPQLHGEVARNLAAGPSFASQWDQGSPAGVSSDPAPEPRPATSRKKTGRKTATRRKTR